MNKAIFFDRDGVLNKTIRRYEEEHSKFLDCAPISLSELNIIENSKKIIEHVKEKGFIPIIITNQPDYLKKNIPLGVYEKITTKICEELEIKRNHVFECLHKEGFSLECECRKPKPGLILMARGLFDIDLKNSWFVGDSWKDMEAAKSAGIENTVFVINRKIELEVEGNEYHLEKLRQIENIPKFKIEKLLELIEIIK
jgi:D-glycero-D-manno-heptose 1,7-bisphosphate phosphatase